MMFGTYSRSNLDRLGFGLKIHTPNYPINIERMVAVFKKRQASSWSGLESLSGRNVIGIRGYGYDKVLDVSMDYSEIGEYSQAFKMLERGRVDFFLDDYQSMMAYVAKNGLDMSAYRIKTIKKENLYVAFPDNEHGRKLGKIFDTEMQKLIATGYVKKAYQDKGIEYPVLKPE